MWDNVSAHCVFLIAIEYSKKELKNVNWRVIPDQAKWHWTADPDGRHTTMSYRRWVRNLVETNYYYYCIWNFSRMISNFLYFNLLTNQFYYTSPIEARLCSAILPLYFEFYLQSFNCSPNQELPRKRSLLKNNCSWFSLYRVEGVIVADFHYHRAEGVMCSSIYNVQSYY